MPQIVAVRSQALVLQQQMMRDGAASGSGTLRRQALRWLMLSRVCV
jgi:hypothetical protein